MPRGSIGSVQNPASAVELWSQQNRKKEMPRDVHTLYNFSGVVVGGKELRECSSVKVLSVTFSANLKWNERVTKCIEGTKKRLYFIVLLKRAKIPSSDIVAFYCTTIRSVLEY